MRITARMPPAISNFLVMILSSPFRVNSARPLARFYSRRARVRSERFLDGEVGGT